MFSTWPALSMVANHYSIERTINEAVERLRVQCCDRSDHSIVQMHPEFRALGNLHMLHLTKPFDQMSAESAGEVGEYFYMYNC
jgi:hypothetical protein